MIDGIVDRTCLRETLATLLGLFADRGAYRPVLRPPSPEPRLRRRADRRPAPGRRLAGSGSGPPPRAAARPRLPGRGSSASWIELHGDRAGTDDPAIIAGLGRIAGIPAAIIAGERGQPAGAGAFRKAERVLRLAGHLELPVVTLVDTPGVESGAWKPIRRRRPPPSPG